jgi:hypothetical protein
MRLKSLTGEKIIAVFYIMWLPPFFFVVYLMIFVTFYSNIIWVSLLSSCSVYVSQVEWFQTVPSRPTDASPVVQLQQHAGEVSFVGDQKQHLISTSVTSYRT